MQKKGIPWQLVLSVRCTMYIWLKKFTPLDKLTLLDGKLSCHRHSIYSAKTSLLYYQSWREKYGWEQTKTIFLFLQLHNRLIDCTDSGNLSFFRLLDATGTALKKYNYHLADLAVGCSNCGTNKIKRVIPWIFSNQFLKGELPVNIFSFIIQFIVYVYH